MQACVAETGDSTSAGIERCLLRHEAQLPADCKCMLHHVMSSRQPPAAASTVTMRAVPVTVSVRTVPTVATAAAEPLAEQRPVHSLSCIFVFTLLFLLSFLLARACISFLCCPPSRRHVVMVPPEQAIITTVGAPAQGAILVTDVVQVAEPLKKSSKA